MAGECKLCIFQVFGYVVSVRACQFSDLGARVSDFSVHRNFQILVCEVNGSIQISMRKFNDFICLCIVSTLIGFWLIRYDAFGFFAMAYLAYSIGLIWLLRYGVFGFFAKP